ncbi:MAG: FHA domain-containing protein [Proteobacteria bacterium]|nr:FHA domain-containing protein [Pseudomonadota bacterium]NOG59468.1 FHA domain-containing protein [Pseudomonadota bacterium]
MSNRRLALLEFDMGWSMWLTEAHLPFHIGRHPDNDLRNSSNCVSRKHCLLDLRDNELCIIDTGSSNGTVLHNQVLQNQELPLKDKTCVLLSDMMIWITPCDHQGYLIQEEALKTFTGSHEALAMNHGVCLVDICDSMQIGLDEVNHISQMLRATIIGREQEKLLLLKHMGDGYLAVFDSSLPAISAAKRLLNWQATSNENMFSANIRVSLDSGITHPSHGHDRTGLPICRAARIEKTQKRDIEIPGNEIDKLKPYNRCVLTSNMSKVLDTTVDERYTFIGKRMLKGFANEMHSIYQYNN